MRQLGEILIERGVITPRDMEEAAAASRELGGGLPGALVRIGAAPESAILAAASELLGLKILPEQELPTPEAIRRTLERTPIPLEWLVKHVVAVWLEEHDGKALLCVAGRATYEPRIQEALQQWHRGEIAYFLAPSQAIETLLTQLDAEPFVAPATGMDATRLRELAEEAPVIDFVNGMLADAIARRASDIHIEPFETKLVIRLRVDGMLYEWRSAPRAMFDAVASRIKLLSGMDIAERRLPQDGRQSIRVSGRELDLRVSSLPTMWGESLVLRFLGKTTTLQGFAALGFSQTQRSLLVDMIEKPHGMVLVTGPTGSGKTTTVYQCIAHLNNGTRKIVTVEDPVEIDLPGVLQVQARPDIGLGFAQGLRSILRQDPDVIFVGEIRDPETAQIAVQAALTGHLVISTLHTSTALASISRLLDLGVEAFLLADVLRGIMGQRLVRLACQACAHESDGEEARAFLAQHPEIKLDAPRWKTSAGCQACNGTGFVGRAAVLEIAAIDERMRQAIRAHAAESELEQLAHNVGFQTMLQDAMAKAGSGVTTFQEALRAAGR